MSRRQQASRVTIGTLIEAARKVKRPNLKSLRQMRRNGRELSSEELAIVCEIFEVDPRKVLWVNPVLAELMDPSMHPSDVQLTLEDPREAKDMFSGEIGLRVPILSVKGSEGQEFVEAVPVFFALINPSMESSYLIDTMKGVTPVSRELCWPYLVRNHSVFLASMMDPNLPWNFVGAATSSLKSGRRGASFEWSEYDGKRNREKVVRWAGRDDLKWQAAKYASALNAASVEVGWQGEMGEIVEDEASTWRHLEKRTLGEVRPGYASTSIVDWAAHARVINLILPYFEDMNRLGIFR